MNSLLLLVFATSDRSMRTDCGKSKPGCLDFVNREFYSGEPKGTKILGGFSPCFLLDLTFTGVQKYMSSVS
jgi:hypothetical protein